MSYYTFNDQCSFQEQIEESRSSTCINCPFTTLKPGMLNLFSKHYNLTNLILYSCNLTSLEGLEKLTNLTTLNIDRNKNITNIEILYSLPKLNFLSIVDNDFTSLEFLRNLPSLAKINIEYNDKNIKDLKRIFKNRDIKIYFFTSENTNFNKIHKINLYKYLIAYRNTISAFFNYKNRIRRMKLERLYLRNKIYLIWFSFFELRKDNHQYNRFSYLCVSEMIK